MEKRSWIDIIEYYKYGSNIHKIPFVSKFLCSIGRHEHDPVKLKNDVYVVMECIFCGERKTARMYEATIAPIASSNNSAAQAIIKDIFGQERSFYDRATSLVRSLTHDNVAEVMASIPVHFRLEFIQFAKEAYLPKGPKISLGTYPVPEECFDVLRAWLESSNY